MASNAPRKMQQRKERRLFSTSDDSAMMKQVQGTHAPDGREIDVKPIIQIIDEILIQVIARGVEGHDVTILNFFSYFDSYMLSV